MLEHALNKYQTLNPTLSSASLQQVETLIGFLDVKGEDTGHRAQSPGSCTPNFPSACSRGMRALLQRVGRIDVRICLRHTTIIETYDHYERCSLMALVKLVASLVACLPVQGDAAVQV